MRDRDIDDEKKHSDRSPQPETTSSADKPSSVGKLSRRRRWRRPARLVAGGLLAMAFGVAVGAALAPREAPSEAAEAEATLWTCSMHPQIKLPKPGKCPICFMDLIPLTKRDDDAPPRQLTMSAAAAALADIQTAPVRRQYAAKTVRMVGKVDYDETRVAEITARVDGRLDRLFVDYTGVAVRRGEHLVSIYSPELIVAQRELLLAWRAAQRGGAAQRDPTAGTLNSVEEKLRLLGLLPEQIEAIKQRGEPTDHLTIHAPIGGVVIAKEANEGSYVRTGGKIYTIADLTTVWVYLDAYESDLPWLRFGQQVEFTTESQPGEVFPGRIAFLAPVLDEASRTVRVRVNAANRDGRLKPGMFVRAEVHSQLAADGRVFDASLAGKWICSMHPEVVQDGPGECPQCEMDLVPASGLGYAAPDKAPELPLLIPATAPLITGKRAVVYVRLPDRAQPTFEGREVLLGARAGDMYIVRRGLKEGELVVTSGNFKIDSSLEIEARPSMMNPGDDAADGAATAGEATPLTVPPAFRGQLSPLYEAYLRMQTALADDRPDDAKAALGHFSQALAKPDEKLPQGRALHAWQAAAAELRRAAAGPWREEDIEALRRRFESLSTAMLGVIGVFGHDGQSPLHRAFCPMAFDNRGAAWLQAGETIANPYFGHKMLRCGSLQRDFPPAAPQPAEGRHER